jgi:Na+/H+ antiporter NhaC
MSKINLKRTLLLAIVFTLLGAVTVFAEPSVSEQNAGSLGLLTLVPPLVAIVLAFITKNVVLSLFLGILSGTLILSVSSEGFAAGVVHGLLDIVTRFINALADPWNTGVILQCLTIGGMIALISKMGGTKAIAEALAKRARSPRSSQIVTWLLGLFVFFDDYANSLIVGPIMRPITDKMKVSREKLSFIVDATAAPVTGLAIISTWVGLELSLIKEGYESIGVNVDAVGVFLDTVPFRFYNILILIFIVLTVVMMREFGSMHDAEMRARTTGKVLRDGATPMTSSDDENLEPKEGIKLNIWNALVPVLVLLLGALAGFYYSGYTAIMGGEDSALIKVIENSPASFTAIRETFAKADASVVLFQSALASSIVAMLMGISSRIFTVKEAIDTWVEGVKSLVITAVILILAWSLSSVVKELGTAHFLTTALKGNMPPFLLPTLIFVLASVISFATGTSYGTMSILMPLAIPLAFGINPEHSYMVINVSAVLTGAIFGDHCSPISDTTILSSMGTSCDHIDHTKTQMTYALVVAAVSIVFGYIPATLGLNVYAALALAVVVLIIILRVFGKKVPEFSVSESSIEGEKVS